jgi:hypothetical protein
MSSGFLRLPAELRNSIYELLVPEPVTVGHKLSVHCRPRWSGHGLLRANRLIHEEASAVFYGRCRFNFIDCWSQKSSRAEGRQWRLEPFLNQIGRNSARIRIIQISFPIVVLRDRHLTISSDSIDVLKLLSQHRPSVRTVYTSIYRTRYEAEKPKIPLPCEVELDCLSHINDMLQIFKEVKQIFVEHQFNTGRSDELLRRIAPLGWIMVSKQHLTTWNDGLIFYEFENSDEE